MEYNKKNVYIFYIFCTIVLYSSGGDDFEDRRRRDDRRGGGRGGGGDGDRYGGGDRDRRDRSDRDRDRHRHRREYNPSFLLFLRFQINNFLFSIPKETIAANAVPLVNAASAALPEIAIAAAVGISRRNGATHLHAASDLSLSICNHTTHNHRIPIENHTPAAIEVSSKPINQTRLHQVSGRFFVSYLSF